MTHSYIEENHIRDRYAAGQLSAEELSKFEEHLSDCPECLDEVEALERFRRGLRTAVTEDAIRRTTLVQTGIRAWLTWAGRIRRTTLLLSLILLVSVPAIVAYIVEAWLSRRQMDQAQTAYADLQREYSQHRQSEERLKEQLRISEEDRRRMEAQANLDRREEAELQMGIAASLPIFTLNHVRDIDQGSPANEVAVSESSRWIILMMEIESDPGVKFYRSKLFSSSNHLIWSATNLKLSSKDSIAIMVRRDLFQFGNYLLRLEGCDSRHQCRGVATYSFHAIVTK